MCKHTCTCLQGRTFMSRYWFRTASPDKSMSVQLYFGSYKGWGHKSITVQEGLNLTMEALLVFREGVEP